MIVAMDTTRRLLSELKPGRSTNRSTLSRRLELDAGTLDEALADLTECGLVECTGKRVVSKAVPGVSTEAALLFAALPSDGSTAGNIRLRAQLGLGEDVYLEAKQELLGSGRVRPGHGKGGTLARVDAQSDGNNGRMLKSAGHQPEQEAPGSTAPPSGGLSETAARILAALPSDGSTVGNIRLRSRLAIEDDAYAAAKQELLEAGRARPGIGRGGTLARIEVQSETQKMATGRLVGREKELYKPFAEWLQKNIAEEQGSEGFRFGHVFVSATPSGHKRNSGQWSRPDVTQIRVVSSPLALEYLPGVTVEVSAYEIKPNAAAEKLDSVYEAVAHGRWAHTANLVVELESEEATVSDTISSEAARLGIGLYTMSRRDDGRFRVRQEIEPQLLKNPDLQKMDELLANTFRENKELRANYRHAIR